MTLKEIANSEKGVRFVNFLVNNFSSVTLPNVDGKCCLKNFKLKKQNLPEGYLANVKGYINGEVSLDTRFTEIAKYQAVAGKTPDTFLSIAGYKELLAYIATTPSETRKVSTGISLGDHPEFQKLVGVFK